MKNKALLWGWEWANVTLLGLTKEAAHNTNTDAKLGEIQSEEWTPIEACKPVADKGLVNPIESWFCFVSQP